MLMVDCRVPVPGLVTRYNINASKNNNNNEGCVVTYSSTTCFLSSHISMNWRASSRKNGALSWSDQIRPCDQISTKDKLSIFSANVCSSEENKMKVSSLPHLPRAAAIETMLQ
jgi:hypothetical protein